MITGDNAHIKPWFIHCFLLIAATVCVYFPILDNNFLYFWDDQWVVMNYYTERGFSISNLWAIFTEFYHGQYAPLNELLYLQLYSLFGYNPFFFHLASLLLHLANVLLVYICINQLLSRSKRVKFSNIPVISFFTALIFAIHPFNVESVAWVSASKILVYAFYYLLATLSFIAYLSNQKIRYYLLTLLFFICSFLGKEQAVTFPLWMLLICWWMGIGFTNKKTIATVLPFFVLSLFFGIITMMSQSAYGGGILSQEASYPFWQRLVYACYTFIEYLIKSVIPIKLSYLYPFPSIIGEPLPTWILIYPTLLIIIFVTFYKLVKSNKLALFVFLFFGIHIVLALHIIPLSRFAVVADRYAYLSTIAVSLVLSAFFIRLYNQWRKNWRRIIPVMLSVFLLAYLGIYAHKRTYVWHDTDSLKKELREILIQREEYKNNKEKQTAELDYSSKKIIEKQECNYL